MFSDLRTITTIVIIACIAFVIISAYWDYQCHKAREALERLQKQHNDLKQENIRLVFGIYEQLQSMIVAHDKQAAKPPVESPPEKVQAIDPDENDNWL
jgi:hypothetical protein